MPQLNSATKLEAFLAGIGKGIAGAEELNEHIRMLIHIGICSGLTRRGLPPTMAASLAEALDNKLGAVAECSDMLTRALADAQQALGDVRDASRSANTFQTAQFEI